MFYTVYYESYSEWIHISTTPLGTGPKFFCPYFMWYFGDLAAQTFKNPFSDRFYEINLQTVSIQTTYLHLLWHTSYDFTEQNLEAKAKSPGANWEYFLVPSRWNEKHANCNTGNIVVTPDLFCSLSYKIKKKIRHFNSRETMCTN